MRTLSVATLLIIAATSNAFAEGPPMTSHLGVSAEQVRAAIRTQLDGLPSLGCGPTANYRTCGGFTNDGLQIILTDTYETPEHADAFKAGFYGVTHAVQASAAVAAGPLIQSRGLAVCATALQLATGKPSADALAIMATVLTQARDTARPRVAFAGGSVYATSTPYVWECGVVAGALDTVAEAFDGALTIPSR